MLEKEIFDCLALKYSTIQIFANKNLSLPILNMHVLFLEHLGKGSIANKLFPSG